MLLRLIWALRASRLQQERFAAIREELNRGRGVIDLGIAGRLADRSGPTAGARLLRRSTGLGARSGRGNRCSGDCRRDRSRSQYWCEMAEFDAHGGAPSVGFRRALPDWPAGGPVSSPLSPGSPSGQPESVPLRLTPTRTFLVAGPLMGIAGNDFDASETDSEGRHGQAQKECRHASQTELLRAAVGDGGNRGGG